MPKTLHCFLHLSASRSLRTQNTHLVVFPSPLGATFLFTQPIQHISDALETPTERPDQILDTYTIVP